MLPLRVDSTVYWYDLMLDDMSSNHFLTISSVETHLYFFYSRSWCLPHYYASSAACAIDHPPFLFPQNTTGPHQHQGRLSHRTLNCVTLLGVLILAHLQLHSFLTTLRARITSMEDGTGNITGAVELQVPSHHLAGDRKLINPKICIGGQD
jgi:hypothetical protein